MASSDILDRRTEMNIPDSKLSHAAKLTLRAARLFDIPIDMIEASNFPFGDFFSQLHPDMMLLVAKKAMVNELVKGADPKTAIDRGLDALVRKDVELGDHFRACVLKLTEEGAARFLSKTRRHPLLNSTDSKVLALISCAFNRTNSEAERTEAIEALETMKQKG
jgi:hypothetical protein